MEYVIVGYAATFLGLGAYAFRIVWRARRLGGDQRPGAPSMGRRS